MYFVLAVLASLSFSELIIATCKIISIPLSFVIIYFSYKFYKITTFTTLQSFAIGFAFILVGDVLILFNIMMDTEYHNEILWIKAILMSYGFSFIAASYYYKSKSGNTLRSINHIFSLAIIPVVFIIVILSVLDVIDLFDYFTVEEYLRVYNLLILGYIIKHVLDSIILSGRKELVYIPLAFVILWFGQFSALIYSFEGDNVTMILRVLFKTIGLSIIAVIILQITKGTRPPKSKLQKEMF